MSVKIFVALCALATGLSMVFGRKGGASDFARRSPKYPGTEEQLAHGYLVLGVLISAVSLLALVVILLDR